MVMRANLFPVLCVPVFLLSITVSSDDSKQQRFVYSNDTENECLKNGVYKGVCKTVQECPELLHKDSKLLNENNCGFKGIIPLVCCPESIIPREGCGRRSITTTRIIGGRISDVGAWPWMVAIFLKSKYAEYLYCGGSLITQKHVITASHCVFESTNLLEPSDLLVRLGEHDLTSDDDNASPIDRSVKIIKHHEKYVARTFENDIAILTLDKPVKFTERIHPVCLPFIELRHENLIDRHAFITGWGKTSYSGKYSDKLREAQVLISDQKQCNKDYQGIVNLTKVYMCAGYDFGGIDACLGDSGGPLMLPAGKDSLFYLVGIVSFGKNCASPNYLGVYTRITEFLDWIRINAT
ncbi:proclotting enzyme-like [Limulus polyphemus]|uniref:Acrosin n=1 Tax=Limulus polyphemus TaxID=6850 RepID=A0ABM1C557_LIMPO|nr:proclotting enzyme-like [Limulus polyphemus]